MSEHRITLRFDSFRGFLEECSDRISEQGIFLATDEIRPVGSRVEFHLGLDANFPLLRGTGEVLWVVEPNGGGEVPGMAVRYESTDEATATLARRIAERQRARSESVFDLGRAGAAAEPPTAEPAPSQATQAVDALIEDAVELETAEFVVPSVEPEAELAPIEPLEPAAAETAMESEPEAESEPRPKRSRGGLWAALALIAALAGAAYWQRDLLGGMLGGSSDDGLAAPALEPQPVEPAEPRIQAPIEPAVEPATEPAIEAPAEPAVEAEAPPQDPAPAAPAPTGPLTRVEEVRWQAAVGVTLLELVADGAFATDGYTLERLEDPPRLLLKIAGVTAPLASPTVAVGSEEVVGVRTGLHGSPPATSLHVVVDLADPTAQVTAAEIRGAVLQLRVASSAISP